MYEKGKRKNSEMSMVDVLAALAYEDMLPRFVGHEAFKHLVALGRVVPGVTQVRVMYKGAIDSVYVADDKYNLIELGDDSVHKARVVLSFAEAPDGWEIYMLKPIELQRGD